jgi:hypothetical protein
VLRRAAPAVAALALLACAAPALAQAPEPGLTTPCGGRAIAPDQVITGVFGSELSKTFVMVPFDVPQGTTAVRVKYCWDRPESGSQRHTLDLGLYEPRRGRSPVWDAEEFRGWGGSSHPDVTLSAEGFSTEAQYTASPRIEVPGKTTRGFIPGPVRPGTWAAELGVAHVVPQADGDTDGRVRWRVEVELSEDPAFKDEPYTPARYDPRPVRRNPGWYAGDMHVHAEHSNYGAATMTETFDYAFRKLDEGGAGLDFLTLSDYVSGYPAWNELGRYQAAHPRNLVVRSTEIITYRGHTNNHGSAQFVDYREGVIYERLANGTLRLIRGSRDPREIFREVHRAGGWTQINHPTIFPPTSSAAAALCRGCFWEYSPAETDYDQVDALEVATGPWSLGGSPNPFTLTAINLYDWLGAGHKIAAVGSSDSHDAGQVGGPLDAPVGTATTVVRASNLSEDGIRCGVQARHTYVKVSGNAGPDIRFTARPWGNSSERAIMGDVVRAPGASFRVKVTGGAGKTLLIAKSGTPPTSVPIVGDSFVHRFEGQAPGRWRIQINEGNLVHTVSSTIWVEPGRGRVVRQPCR